MGKISKAELSSGLKAEIESKAKQVDLVSQEVDKGASLIGLNDSDSNFESTNVEGALSELFQSVSNGKQLIATAITDKEVPTSSSDSFQQMANNILSITTGFNVSSMIANVNYTVRTDAPFHVNMGGRNIIVATSDRAGTSCLFVRGVERYTGN